MTKNCGNCKFFKPKLEDLRRGLCLALPPSVFPVQEADGNMSTISCWPPVSANQWCGKFEPRILGVTENPAADNDGKEKPKDA